MRNQADTITIRTAGDADGAALRRLAALDSAGALAGPALLAEVGGVPAAAIAIDGGVVVADPFRLTADIVELLELRRARLATGEASGRGRGRRERRLRGLTTKGGLRHASAHLW